MNRVTVAALLDVGGFRTISEQAADAAERLYGGPIGDELRALFARAEGEYLGGHSFMRVFELDELADVIGQSYLYEGGLAGHRYFASDDGDGFYAITPAGAVVLVDRGAARAENAKPCASDLVAFIKRTLEGEMWLGDTRETQPEIDVEPPAPPATRRTAKPKPKARTKAKPRRKLAAKSKAKPKAKSKAKPTSTSKRSRR